MAIITVDLDEASQLATEGGKYVFKREAEEAILKLMELRDAIDEQISKVKEDITRAGLSIDPSFKGVVGHNVKAIYRVFGEKYDYELGNRDDLFMLGFLKKNEQYKVDSKKVDEYFKAHNKLPDGVRVKERAPVISLTRSTKQLNDGNAA